MRKIIWILPLMCAFAFGQANTSVLGGKAKLGGVAGLGTATGSALPTVTKIGQLNFTNLPPYTITVTGNAAIGDTILLMCGSQGANAGTHYSFIVSDSVSNTWTYPTVSTNTSLQFLDTANQEAITVPYAATIATGYTSGVTTITVNNGAVSDGATGGCDVLDITGLLTSPFDNAVGTTANVSTTLASGSYTPGTQPEVILAIFSGSTNFWSAYLNIIGSAATGIDHRSGGTNSASQSDIVLEWRRVTLTTAGTATMTQVSNVDGNGSIIMGFKSN